MGKRYRVTAEYVTVTTADPLSGKRVLLGFYRDAILPHDMTDEEIEHHLSTKQIEEATDLPDEQPEYDEESQAVVDAMTEPTPEVVAGSDVPEPRKNAERAEWVDYAVSKGADRDEIERDEVSRADLIAAWGTPK